MGLTPILHMRNMSFRKVKYLCKSTCVGDAPCLEPFFRGRLYLVANGNEPCQLAYEKEKKETVFILRG